MNKRSIIINLFVSFYAMMFFLTGCSFIEMIASDLRESEVIEEDLEIFHAVDYISYEYSEKVTVLIHYSDMDDSLELATTDDEDWWYSTYSALSGEFEKVAWADYNLFILMEGKYYSFDIKSYEIPPLDEDGDPMDPEYELKEYSESEFKELYPDWESFDWYGH